MLTPILAQSGEFWFPEQASTIAPTLDWNYLFIYWTCVVFFVIIIVAMAYFMVRYRRRHEHEVPEKSATHNNALEMLWSIIPAFLVVYMFWIGFRGFMDMRTMPVEGVFPIDVVAKKWNWEFQYDGGKTIVGGRSIEYDPGQGVNDWADARSKADGDRLKMDELMLAGMPEMHVPFDPDNPVKVVLTMRSLDVLHAFSVPAFRVKQDVVPGRFTKLWFEPTQTGRYFIECMEYCGDKHSEMWGVVVVETPEEFAVWIEDQRDPFKKVRKRMEQERGVGGFTNDQLIVEVGHELFRTRGCATCHSAESENRNPDNPDPGRAPGFKGNFGTKVSFQDGSEGVVDEAFIRQSILTPQAKVRRGFTAITMPPQSLKESTDPMKDEVGAIVAFLKSLQ